MTNHSDFITIYKCMAGWKAVHMTWTEEPDLGQFCEPWQTSYFAYETAKEAEKDAITWAEASELEYIRPPKVHHQ